MLQQQGFTVFDAFEMFLLDCEARQFTKHTLRFYRGRLGLFVRWCAEKSIGSIVDLTAVHLRLYLVETQRREVSSAYLHSHARALRAFFNYCVRDELLENSPFARVQMPQLEKKILDSLTPAEVKSVLSACTSERDHALVLFLLDSGVRASELCSLDVDDVDLATGAVQVRKGKGQKGRTVFIEARTRKQVRRYISTERDSTHPALFVSQRNGERLTYSGLAQTLQRLGQDAQVRGCSAHALRRTFAINCLRGGMNIYVLAKLMGHADILVLRQYLSLVEDDLKNAHAQAAVVDRVVGQGGRRNRDPPELRGNPKRIGACVLAWQLHMRLKRTIAGANPASLRREYSTWIYKQGHEVALFLLYESRRKWWKWRSSVSYLPRLQPY